jgi:hypothetical protein
MKIYEAQNNWQEGIDAKMLLSCLLGSTVIVILLIIYPLSLSQLYTQLSEVIVMA